MSVKCLHIGLDLFVIVVRQLLCMPLLDIFKFRFIARIYVLMHTCVSTETQTFDLLLVITKGEGYQ